MYQHRRRTTIFIPAIVLLLVYIKITEAGLSSSSSLPTTIAARTTTTTASTITTQPPRPFNDNWDCGLFCDREPDIICCESCICDITCNSTKKQCCEGKVGRTIFQNNAISYLHCHSAAFLTVNDPELTGEKYIFISACEPSETNQTLIELCVAKSLTENSESFFQTLPVTSKSGVSFRNKYCALCNGVTGFSFWDADAEIKCKKKRIDGKTFTEVIEQVRNSNNKCNILFKKPLPEINVPRCAVIDTCHQTDYETGRSCKPTTTSYSFSEDGFKTKQCFTCSGEEMKTGCYQKQTFGFSVLLDFNSKYESTKIVQRIYSKTCGENEIYDNIMDTCLMVKCIPPAILSNFRCINMYKTIKRMQYELIIKVFVQNPEHFTIKCHTCIQKLISQIDETYHSFDFINVVGGRRNIAISFLKVSEAIPVENGRDSFVLIWDNFMITHNHDYISFVSDLVSSVPDEVNVTIFNETVTLNFFIVNDHDQIPAYGLDIIYKQCDMCSNSNLIHHLKICPHVSINKHLFKYFYLDDYLCFSNVTLCIRRDRYMDYGDSISICYEDYTRFYDLYDTVTQNQTEVLVHENESILVDETEIILSEICTILSVISLLVVLFTYLLFPTLRTLPGLNNIALCVSMFLAHLLYQFGMKQTHLGTGCIALGIMTHFTWILTITWQTICCLHVFRVFVTQADMTSSRSSKYKSFLFYLLFSFVFSAAVVSSNIIVKMVSSDHKDIGYGGKICYINDPFMLALTFALPLGLSVVTNIILILVVSIKFCRMPDLQKNVKNERNNIAIFAKLSTLTGVTWILGFIYGWTNNKVLLYIFVILTPLQGMFIMISFVCNKRVFGLYKSVIVGKKNKNQSSRSTLKSNVYSTDVSLSTFKSD